MATRGGGSSRPVVAATWRRDIARRSLPGHALVTDGAPVPSRHPRVRRPEPRSSAPRRPAPGAGRPPVTCSSDSSDAPRRPRRPRPCLPSRRRTRPPDRWPAVPPATGFRAATRRPAPPATAPGRGAVPYPYSVRRCRSCPTAPVRRRPGRPPGAVPLPSDPTSLRTGAIRPPARSAGPGRPESRAQAVQRAAANAGVTGVPVRAARRSPQPGRRGRPPARRRFRRYPGEPAERDGDRGAGPAAPRPGARLIRADLRRGRERGGRLHDGRR
ncbi:hypothetical protein SBADM41S_05808 [Streptomyces badius]